MGEGSKTQQPAARKKEDRAPQWGSQETADFIAFCSKLEQGVTQHNKTVWKTIASRMKQRGYCRSPAQCECMWRNLVNSYKGKESLDAGSSQQRPYFEELHAIFTSKSKKIDNLPSDLGLDTRKKKRSRTLDRFPEEFSEEEDEDDDDSEGERMGKSKKRKLDRERKRATAEKGRANNMRVVLEHFFQLQQSLELQWREILKQREEEYQKREQEYRSVMASLESESFLREQHWYNKDEQWRAREEARADSRDHLFSAILDKLVKREL